LRERKVLKRPKKTVALKRAPTKKTGEGRPTRGKKTGGNGSNANSKKSLQGWFDIPKTS